jgi:hypothetical protein
MVPSVVRKQESYRFKDYVKVDASPADGTR